MSGGPRVQAPELKKFMEKRLAIKLNGARKISGVLRGFDQFMNLVLDEAVEEVSAAERNEIGMVVRAWSRAGCCPCCLFACFIGRLSVATQLCKWSV